MYFNLFYRLFIEYLNTVPVHLLFLKTILLLREIYILSTFYFSYVRFKKVSHCPKQVFISLNCLRFEWDNIHKILNPVPWIQQALAIVTIFFLLSIESIGQMWRESWVLGVNGALHMCLFESWFSRFYVQ